METHPQAKIAIGPPIENGFYYDFDLGQGDDGKPRTFTPEDLEAIEKRMRQVIAGRHPFQYRQVSADEARQLFTDQPYKLELIDGLAQGGIDEYGNETDEAPVISTYKHDTFEDLCRGPHLEHTGQIPADALSIDIDSTGRVFVAIPGEAEPQEVGQIEIATFVNPAGLKQIGENLYVESAASGPPILGEPGLENRGRLIQGMIEASNVDPTRELIELIRTQRAFEMNSQTIRTADETLRSVAQLRR